MTVRKKTGKQAASFPNRMDKHSAGKASSGESAAKHTRKSTSSTKVASDARIRPPSTTVAVAASSPLDKVIKFIRIGDARGLREYFHSLLEAREDMEVENEDEEENDGDGEGANYGQYTQWAGVVQTNFFLKKDAVPSTIQDLYLATDPEGNSLLFLALEKKCFEIAAILLSYRFPSDFGNNTKDKSPLCLMSDLLTQHKDKLYNELTEDLKNWTSTNSISNSSEAPPDWGKIAAILVFRLSIPDIPLSLLLSGDFSEKLVATVLSKDIALNSQEKAEFEEAALKLHAQQMRAASIRTDTDREFLKHLEDLESFSGSNSITDHLAYGTRSLRGMRVILNDLMNNTDADPLVRSALRAFMSPMKKRVQFIMCLQDAVTTLSDRRATANDKGAVCKRV
jgi:hypothetical protein